LEKALGNLAESNTAGIQRLLAPRCQRLFLAGSLLAALFLTLCCKKETAPPAPIKADPRNLLMITIDTLRPDALSIYGNKLRSNFFESIASQSVVFDNAYTTAPITLPAHTSLLTGMYPPAHGVRNNGTFRASSQLLLLSEKAKQNGFHTAAFIGAFPLASQFGLDQGFDVYDDNFSASQAADAEFVYAERNAEQVRLQTQSWLSKQDPGNPFFVWMHLFDPHHPYVTHDASSSTHPYLQEVQYVDRQLGLLYEFLRSRNLLHDTAIVITSDHGEAFGEHGEVSHSIFLYNTTLRIPLLLSVPGVPQQRHNDLVRIVDIFPTLTDMMRWSDSQQRDGRSLLPLLEGKTLPRMDSYAETLAPALDFGWSPLFSIQTGHFKYIDAPKPELYDLQSDPKETNNLIPSSPGDSYRAKLRAIQSKQTVQTESAPALSKEDREKLESMGYLSGSSNAKAAQSKIDPKDRIHVARKIAELTMTNQPLSEKAKAYESLVVSEPSNPLLLLRYAEILLKLNRYQDATAAFREVIHLNYPAAEAYNGLAAVYFQQNQPEEARKFLETAVSKKLADGETYFNLAEFYLNRGMQEKAFQYYEESVRFQFLPAFFRHARLLEILGRTKEAFDLLNQAEEINPSNAEVHFHSGMIYFRHQKFAEAIQQFQRVLQKEPQAKWILFNIGVTYNRLGDRRKANAALQAFLRDGPHDMKSERDAARRLLKEIADSGR
jgi:choline-sulfatase